MNGYVMWRRGQVRGELLVIEYSSRTPSTGASRASGCPRNRRKGNRTGHDVGLSSQQTAYILQFGGDVDLLRAGRQAVAAADAGRAVFRQGGVFPLRAVEVVIIPGVPLVPEDVRDRDVLGASG